ncbi:MAG: hypothetical protein FJY37_03280, partial [Betaproteobacteria bacterium]|nr:hypothetical protein [Betaproteobacteria bacterium]
MAELDKRSAKQLVELLETPTIQQDSTVAKRIDSSPQSDSTANGVSQESTDELPGEKGERSKSTAEHQSQELMPQKYEQSGSLAFDNIVIEVASAWDRYSELATLQPLSQGEVNPVERLKWAEQHTASLRRCHEDLEKKAQSVVQILSNRLDKLRADVPIDVVAPVLELPSSIGFKRWRAECDAFWVSIDGAVETAKPLREVSREAVAEASKRLPRKSYSLSQIPTVLEDFVEDACLVDDYMKASASLRATIELRWHEPSWNMLSDASLARYLFVQIGRGMLRERKLTPVLGVIVRHCFSDLAEEYCAVLSDVLMSDPKDHLRAAIATTSRLTLPQVEELSQRHPELASLFAVLEIESALVTGATDAGESAWYLHAVPLNSYWSAPADQDYQRSLFYALLDNITRKIEMRRKDVCAIVANAMSEGRAELSDPEGELKRELRSALAFHPGGGGGYARLWKLVYGDLFAPLRNALDEGGIAEFRKKFFGWNEKFSIEDHLHRWKSTLPQWLRKNSEYDKKIRLAVATLSTTIKELLARGEVRIESNDDSVAHAAIRLVLDSEDRRATLLKAWLDQLASGREFEDIWPVSRRDAFGADWEAQYPLLASVQ